MEAIDLNTEAHESSPETGFGERLVAARKARGLALADVTQMLRLPAAALQALESARYEELPAPVFVRGYLRTYARLLGMDGEVLVAEYDRLVASPEPDLRLVTKVGRQTIARDLCIRGAAASTLVVMVVVLGSWLYGRLQHDVPAQSGTASWEAEQSASLVSVHSSPAQVDSPSPGFRPAVALAPDTPPLSPVSAAAEESVVAVEPDPPKGETAAAVEPVLPVANDSPVIVNADAVEQRRELDATVEPAVPDLPIAPLAAEHGGLVRASRAPRGEEVIVIKANEESWAEVVDANGYQLLYYLLRPGMERRMQGQAPFRVFLGNAPAVELSLNQERFDHTPFRRRNSTARFSVDDPLVRESVITPVLFQVFTD